MRTASPPAPIGAKIRNQDTISSPDRGDLLWPTGKAVGMRSSSNLSRGSGDIKITINPDAVMSPLSGLLPEPGRLRAPMAFAMGHIIPPLPGLTDLEDYLSSTPMPPPLFRQPTDEGRVNLGV